MATTGTYTNNFRTGYAVKLIWNVLSQNVSANSSTVEVKVQLVSTGASYTINSSATKSGTLTVNGTAYAFTFSAALSGNQTKTILTKTIQVPHSSDGTKSCAFNAKCGIAVTLGGTYYGDVTVSGTGTFNTIPRASTPSLSASSVEMGTSITINTNPASSDFRHTLTYKFGTKTGTIATGVAATRTWTVPLTFADEVPNATSGLGTITCQTYSGSTLIGTKSVTFTALVPASIVPTISGVTVTEAVEGIAAKFSAFLQNKSKLAVAVSAAGAYSSTISSYKTYIQAVEYHGASFTSNVITASGNIGVVTVVTDSRGRTATFNQTITVLVYVNPIIRAFSAFRANADGTQNYEGERLNISFDFSISPVNQLNDKYYEIVYRQVGVTAWSFVASGNVYELNSSLVTGALFSGDYAYEVVLNLYDFSGSASAAIEIATAFTLVDFRSTGKGIAFGKVSEKDAMEIALDVEITGNFIQENKQTPTLLNGWVNYGAGYNSAYFWRDKNNVVHLSGLIKSGATAAETVILTLPVGYRPVGHEKFITVSANLLCVLDLYANGNLVVKTGANASWISLSGISFKVG